MVDAIISRSSHNTLATRTGGITLYSVIFLVMIYLYFKGEQSFDFSIMIPISIMFIVGVYDDLYHADYRLKLFMQIVVAKILIDLGYVIDNFHGIFGWHEIPWLLAQITTIFVFIVLVNAYNFIDGLDGLAMTEFLKLIIIFEIFFSENTPFYFLNILLIVTILPLFYFNLRVKNKVFLGDGGSLLIGTLASVYVFYILKNEYTFNFNLLINKALFTILLCFYPLVDLLRVFVNRISKRQSPFLPDKNHLHHLIFQVNKSHILTLLIIHTTSLIIFLCGILLF